MAKTLSKYLVGAGCVFLVMAAVLIAQPAGEVSSAPAPQENADGPTIAAFSKAGCAVCHSIPGVPNAAGQVGPDLTAIGQDAETRVSGQSAADYMLESILKPNAFIAPNCPLGACPSDVMPPNLADKLTSAELGLIIDYLLTLTGEGEFVPVAYNLEPIEIVRPAEADYAPFADPPKTYDDGQVLLGKYLFFDARLSGNANVSCASCHLPDQSWTDGLALSNGYPSTAYFRNTPTLLNTVYMESLYWDGRMDGADMPTLVRDHLTEAHFMNTDGRLMVERVKQIPEYVRLFEDVWGKGPSFGGILNSITAYVGSLNSAPTAFDTGTLSADAQAGLELFEGKAGCAACHSGPTFSDSNFYATGVPENPDIWANPLRHITFRRFFRLLGTPNYRALDLDPGFYALTLMPEDLGAFRTAPLREVALTAPYMHNGAFSTLGDVVQFYNSSLSLDLTAAEAAQLVAFLESLSSDRPAVEVPDLPEYQLRPLGDNR
jgi:cytochrome c peroxidase